MEPKYYKSRVDWWVYASAALPFAFCAVWLAFDSGANWLPAALCFLLGCLMVFCYCSISYAIKGDMLGVRAWGKWTWYPIAKISSIGRVHSVLSAPALSSRRVAIRFTDRNILRSADPLWLSPLDDSGFISEIIKINPSVAIK